MHEEHEEIVAAISYALAKTFQDKLVGLNNPYGDGTASARIVKTLLEAPLERLVRKPPLEPRASDEDLGAMLVRANATLRDVMTTIDRNRHQIAFVVDDDNRLLGSISDGDIRRAILSGVELEDHATSLMNRVPVTARPGDDWKQAVGLMATYKVNQLPVVDANRRVIGIHLLKAILGDVIDDVVRQPSLQVPGSAGQQSDRANVGECGPCSPADGQLKACGND